MTNEIMLVWRCPEILKDGTLCDAENTDDYASTVFPMCCGCGAAHDWEDVLDADALRKANSDLAAYNQVMEAE